MASSSTSGLGHLNISPNTGDLAEIVRLTCNSQEYWLCSDWLRRGWSLPICVTHPSVGLRADSVAFLLDQIGVLSAHTHAEQKDINYIPKNCKYFQFRKSREWHLMRLAGSLKRLDMLRRAPEKPCNTNSFFQTGNSFSYLTYWQCFLVND